MKKKLVTNYPLILTSGSTKIQPHHLWYHKQEKRVRKIWCDSWKS